MPKSTRASFGSDTATLLPVLNIFLSIYSPYYRHDPEEPYSLSHNFVSDILEDNVGYLWASTTGGLNRIDRQRESFVRYLAQPIV